MYWSRQEQLQTLGACRKNFGRWERVGTNLDIGSVLERLRAIEAWRNPFEHWKCGGGIECVGAHVDAESVEERLKLIGTCSHVLLVYEGDFEHS